VHGGGGGQALCFTGHQTNGCRLEKQARAHGGNGRRCALAVGLREMRHSIVASGTGYSREHPARAAFEIRIYRHQVFTTSRGMTPLPYGCGYCMRLHTSRAQRAGAGADNTRGTRF